MEGKIFELANSAMPSIFFIETAATNQKMESSLKNFYNESVPLPFSCLYETRLVCGDNIDNKKSILSNWSYNNKNIQ